MHGENFSLRKRAEIGNKKHTKKEGQSISDTFIVSISQVLSF